ncbi:MAG: hypothetical protein K6F76_00595 [Clostridiales bacterium]|nr:hypothetical protein [Clostridiales bacterium]
MDYKEWAEEYRRDLENLKEMIDRLKAERTIIQCSKNRSLLEDRIASLYEMYVECRKTYRILEARANGAHN